MNNTLAIIKRQNETLHKLNNIASISNVTPKETLREALIIGKEYFCLEFGIVSHVVDQEYTCDVQSSPPDTLYDTQLFALGSTYCKTTLELDDVLAITDVTKSKYVGHPCHTELALVSYIGAPIRVNGKVYGTINFSSPNARQLEYDEIDDSFMKLLARWAGSFLERQFSLDQLNLFSEAVKQIDDIIMITDKKGILTFVNDAFCRYTGFSREESIGRNPSIIKSNKNNKDFFNEMWKQILSGKNFRGLVTNSKKNGKLYYEEKSITPIKNDEGNIISFISVGKDVTDRIKMEHNLEKLASTDKLTSTYNRHKFEELLENELKRINRYKNQLSLIMFDIDYFKKVNDNYGHDVGDNVLVAISNLVKKNIRNTDIFSRWGGEEFLILCPETSTEEAQILAEKLRHEIEIFSFDKVAQITASFGVTTYRDKDNRNLFIKRVDDSLYMAKNEGRNIIKVAEI